MGLSNAHFAVYMENTETLACYAEHCTGFFTQKYLPDGRFHFTLIRTYPQSSESWQLISKQSGSSTIGNCDLWILDSNQNKIGSYFIADLQTGSKKVDSAGDMELTLSGWMWSPPNPAAESVWRSRYEGPPKDLGEWKDLSELLKEAWLEVARIQNSPQVNVETKQDASPHTQYMIDANSIGSSVDFFCALGESINGPGGYFGDNLDSLSDCLCGGFGASVPFTINVRHGKKLTDRLPPQFLSDLIEVMSHAKVTLNLEYK